jgi:hypothetical protein
MTLVNLWLLIFGWLGWLAFAVLFGSYSRLKERHKSVVEESFRLATRLGDAEGRLAHINRTGEWLRRKDVTRS